MASSKILDNGETTRRSPERPTVGQYKALRVYRPEISFGRVETGPDWLLAKLDIHNRHQPGPPETSLKATVKKKQKKQFFYLLLADKSDVCHGGSAISLETMLNFVLSFQIGDGVRARLMRVGDTALSGSAGSPARAGLSLEL